jgi:hypothetical protein
MFCDLAKAFGYINHEILLNKFHFYGIQETAAKWFRFYLMGGKQKVENK